MIRPRPARWFEILAARDDATLALTALAATGAVELEARGAAALPDEFAEIAPMLAQFTELQARYHSYWPRTERRCSPFPERPALALTRALGRLRAWATETEPLIARLQRIDAERAELLLWRRVFMSMRDADVDLVALHEPPLALHKRLFVFPAESKPQFPAGTLAHRVDDDTMIDALVVGAPDDVRAVAQQCAAAKGRAYDPPPWLQATAEQTMPVVERRLEALDLEQVRLRADLEASYAAHDLHTALGDVDRLQWVLRNVRALEAGDLFCWITGWTSDWLGHALGTALGASGARALLHFPPPPRAARPPLLLQNPWWVRPYEIFCRALGMPSGNEADPSALLAIAVPLMFGYMFGDVGQGAVIAVGGFVLRRRFAIARLFVAGGLSAMVFGLLFGSVFGLHDVIPAAWIHPLDAPLDVLVVPLYGGAALLLIGLLLSGLEAFWRGELWRWLATEGALAVAYVALLASFAAPGTLAIAGAAALWFCAGHGVVARDARASLVAAAELLERLFQLAINTLSFARVGAFALAHAGLSAAIVSLMQMGSDSFTRTLVLGVGNIVVIVLEAMVVSIQTTRLVLFEFFTRFLVAEGRLFRPLPPPPATLQET